MPSNLPANLKIVSGGQTGVDRAALDVALEEGVPCGGWCGADRLAEDGPIPARYPVMPLPAGKYRQRTRQNVLDSDGTVIIHPGPPQGGSLRTLNDCQHHCKPFLVIDAAMAPDLAANAIAEFIRQQGIQTLNVAGARASKQPAIYQYTQAVMRRLLIGRGIRGDNSG